MRFVIALWLGTTVWGQTTGQPQEAVRVADEMLRRDPNNAQVWTVRGLALARLKDERAGLASVRRALAIAPDYVPALRGGAQIAYALRDPSAKEFLLRLVRIEPRDETAHAMLGSLASEAGDCKGSMAELRLAPTVLDSNGDALQQLGNCELATGGTSEAIQTFRKLMALDAQNPTARYKLAEALGATDEAMGLLKNLPPKGAVLRLLASYDAKRKDPQAAVAVLEQAIALDPGDEESYLDLGAVYIEQRQPEKALAVMNEALEHMKPTAKLLTVRGAAFTWLNEGQQAARDFAEAEELAPEQLYGAVGLSMLLRQRQDLPRAIEILRGKLAERPDDATLNYLLADTLIRTGAAPGQAAFGEAVTLLRKALRLDPKFQKAHVTLGKLYLRGARTKEAIEQFEEALRLDADDRSALTQLVIVLRRDGREREAEALSGRLRALVLADEQRPGLP